MSFAKKIMSHAHRQVSRELCELRAALRDFPQFHSDSCDLEGPPITPEKVREIAREYFDMLYRWQPIPHEVEFWDYGKPYKIVWDPGDMSVGISDGWFLEEGFRIVCDGEDKDNG